MDYASGTAGSNFSCNVMTALSQEGARENPVLWPIRLTRASQERNEFQAAENILHAEASLARRNTHSVQRRKTDDHIVSTTRNSALPLIMRSNPSAARASGKDSIMGRTPVRAANRNVSSESAGVPAAQPWIRFRPRIS